MKKIENFLLFILLLIGIFYPVSALTRTISDSSDTYYTFIYNTKGNYWEATGSNLQLAINDIGTDGGTVYVGSDITLTNSLTLKDYCIVDFLGNTVTLQNDKPFINVTSALMYSTVRNVKVVVSDNHTSPVIYCYYPVGTTWSFRFRFNNFENIYIKNPSILDSKGEWTEHNYTGIAYLLDANNTDGGRIYLNHFENIHMEGVKIGILFSQYSTIQDYPNMHNVTHYINGEYFKNIYIDQFETAVSVNTTDIELCNENVFENLIAKTASFSKYGIKNISRFGIDFVGGVINWEKAENPVALFTTDKQWDYGEGSNLSTAYMYANWCAPYNATYMIDVTKPSPSYYYNFLMADGKIKWTTP